MQQAFFSELSQAKSVLIAGAGGGFDVISGLPLYFYLRRQGVAVTLANLSFTELAFAESRQVFPQLYQISAHDAALPYFPEKYLLEFLQQRGEDPAVYAFAYDVGVQPLRAAYAWLAQTHQIDTIVLVDGGTDSLMFGDEAKVGTLVEDACSIIAAAKIPCARRLLLAIGFGVEHEFNHHACLQNIASLCESGDFLGSFSLTPQMPEGQAFLQLTAFLNQRMPLHTSIVTNSIAGAMRGAFGDIHVTARSRDSEQFLSPLMSLYWSFKLDGLAARIQFGAEIEHSQTMSEVAQAFKLSRIRNPRRAHQSIPLK
ncbi:DUF1152 domain-containing protein [Massilia sp. W12]|uniref:DUF1152 domain-containing protein n=1 Tax=Massilia sp. W12 TaxID=3126507 RepID=UPI0030CDE659